MIKFWKSLDWFEKTIIIAVIAFVAFGIYQIITA